MIERHVFPNEEFHATDTWCVQEIEAALARIVSVKAIPKRILCSPKALHGIMKVIISPCSTGIFFRSADFTGGGYLLNTYRDVRSGVALPITVSAEIEQGFAIEIEVSDAKEIEPSRPLAIGGRRMITLQE